MITLWRNGRLLGRVRFPFPGNDPGTIGGMLHLTEEYPDVSPLIQVRLREVPETPILQHRIPIHSGRPPSHVEVLRKLDPEEAKGVGPEEVFQVRNDEGVVLAIDVLMIDRWLGDSEEAGPEVVTACDALGVSVSPWSITARLTQPVHEARRGSQASGANSV